MAGWAQDLWAVYENDASHATSTIVGSQQTEATLATGIAYQARQGYYTDNATGDKVVTWQFSHEGGAWTTVDTTPNAISPASSIYYSHGDTVTQRLSSSTPWETGCPWVIEATGVTPAHNFGGEKYCEAVLTFGINTPYVDPGDQIELRIWETNLVISGTLDILVEGGDTRRIFVI
jgi:hypothetical protein